MPGWDSGYSASLENSFPQGFAGSNPAPGVLSNALVYNRVTKKVVSDVLLGL